MFSIFQYHLGILYGQSLFSTKLILMYCWKNLKYFNTFFYSLMFFMPYAFLFHSFNNVGIIWQTKSFFSTFYILTGYHILCLCFIFYKTSNAHFCLQKISSCHLIILASDSLTFHSYKENVFQKDFYRTCKIDQKVYK